MIVDAQEGCCLGVARYARINVTIRDQVYLADVPLVMLVGIVLRPWGRGHGPQRRWVPGLRISRGRARLVVLSTLRALCPSLVGSPGPYLGRPNAYHITPMTNTI